MEVADLDYKLVSLFTPEQAHQLCLIPFREDESKLTCLAVESDAEKLSLARLLLGREICLELISSDHFQRLLLQSYPTNKIVSREAQQESRENSDAVDFIEKILESALQMNASDIHIECYQDLSRVRFRWEGQLVEKHHIPLSIYPSIISRIKIMADMDISEKRLPQDGRIHTAIQDQKIDIRVSSIPGKFGEKIVMRLLSRTLKAWDLDQLGFRPQELSAYQQAIQKPNGIILITGPTGSGKTSTLYTTLYQLNLPGKNITTIEDPIEYTFSGINQVQMKDEIGLSFDRALKSFLRQDPDILMVGEIRDTSTAKIAIRAAMTGHLVFSTLHTNGAIEAISRLTDMGIEPYLLAGCLRVVIAQRLLRLLCDHCKSPNDDMLHVGFQETYSINRHWRSIGCRHCHFTGYRGRKAVFEVLPIDQHLKRMIRKKQELDYENIIATDLLSMNENLAELVRSGATSLEEALVHYQ
ncbi:MAG: GspE/PulE family protein [Bacteroidota bacterium]